MRTAPSPATAGGLPAARYPSDSSSFSLWHLSHSRESRAVPRSRRSDRACRMQKRHLKKTRHTRRSAASRMHLSKGGHKESSLISTAAGRDVLKRLASSKVKISWLKIRNQRIAITGLEIRRSCEWGGNAPGDSALHEC